MHRRRVLSLATLIGTGVMAGCLEADEDPAIATYTLETDSTPPEAPIAYHLELSEPAINDPERPLTIDLELTNTGEETIRYRERRRARFWTVADGRYTLVPMTQFQAYSFDSETGVWVMDEPFYLTTDIQIGQLAPAESHGDQLLVLVESIDQLPGPTPASLRFESEITVELDDPEERPDQSAEEGGSYSIERRIWNVEWGFTLLRDD